MITLKTKYALKALMVLADEKAVEGSALRIEEIAERSGAPKRFLEHILLDTMYELPGLEGVEEVVISGEVVEGQARPLHIYADRAEDVGTSA